MSIDKAIENKAQSGKYIDDEITYTIKTYGKRAPGSEGEKNAVNYMAEKCKEYGCDDVNVEGFKLNPGAFMGWIYFTVSFLLTAFALYFVGNLTTLWWLKIVSFVLLGLGIVLMVGEFILYRKVVDKLFKEQTSYNLTATKKPTGEVKKRIFFNGHPDAAGEWLFNYLLGGRGFAAHFVISIVGLVYLIAILIASFFVTSSIALILGLSCCAFLPFWVGLYWLWSEKKTVDGANDNLSGCFMGIAVLKALQEQGIEFEHTEVGVLISGSEEAGLRGAKAWCEAHKDDYKDAETVIIAYDTIREKQFLCVNTKDLNSTVKADEELSNTFKKAADELGILCNFGVVPFGATDSAAFNQGGFRAIGVTAMDHNLKDYYHTRRDTIGNTDAECLADCFAVSMETLKKFSGEE